MIIQQKLRKPYRMCAVEEDTLLGLLALALSFSGRMPSVSAAVAALTKRYPSEVCTSNDH